MKSMLEELYMTLSEQAENDPDYRSKWQSTKTASLSLLEELESRCGESCRELLDVITSLEAQRNSAHEQAVFHAALCIGMELGRISVS